VNGVAIRTSEALYQACRFPHLPDVQHKIINEHSPMTTKMRVKPFRKDSRPDWDTVRVKIMRWSLRVKLAQNWREFGRLLLATGDRPIVEQSRKDDFWGAKVAEEGSLVRWHRRCNCGSISPIKAPAQLVRVATQRRWRRRWTMRVGQA
jgi:type I restriction enzyme S subunit